MRTREDSVATAFSRSTAPTSVQGHSTPVDPRATIQRMATTVNALNKMSDELYNSVAELKNKNSRSRWRCAVLLRSRRPELTLDLVCGGSGADD